MLVATLAKHVGIEALAADLVRLRRDRPGAANAGAQRDGAAVRDGVGTQPSIEDTDQLRAGARAGCGRRLPPPSTLGTFCGRYVRARAPARRAAGPRVERAWAAGAGPGDRRTGR